jgi:hypothetical protein
MAEMTFELLDKEKTKQNVSELIRKAPFSTYKLHDLLAEADREKQGVSLQCVYQWSNPDSKKLPSLPHLVLLAAVCNVTLGDIIAVKKKENIPSDTHTDMQMR